MVPSIENVFFIMPFLYSKNTCGTQVCHSDYKKFFEQTLKNNCLASSESTTNEVERLL